MKKILLVSIFVIIATNIITFLSVMYFTSWQEPKASYFGTDNPKLLRIRQDLKELKVDLRREGIYNCCIRNDCGWCALYMGHCPCAELVMEKQKEKSCPECTAAWNRRQGKVPGIDPDAIEVTTFGVYGYEEGGHHHEHE